MEMEVPGWLIEKYGRAQALHIYQTLLDRYALVTFNSKHQHPKQVEFIRHVLNNDTKFNFCITGNRFGKTEAGAAIVVYFVTGIRPWCIGGTGFEDIESMPPPRHVWIVSLDHPSNRDTIRPKLERYLPRNLLKEWRLSDQQYVFKNGATIGLKSCESGREKFQGVSRDLIWMDEEPSWEIFHECVARTVDTGGKIVCTMTPLKGFSWSYSTIWLKQNEDPDIFVMHGAMEDNPYLPRKEIERVKRQWVDPAMRDARMSGLYTLMHGAHVFNPDAVTKYMGLTCDPDRTDAQQGLEIWEEPKAETQYVIGADTGKGKQKGDYSAAVVLDCHHRNVVAILRSRCDSETFGYRLNELGHYYNDAVINPERNDHGIVTIDVLRRLHYPRIWRRRKVGRIAPSPNLELGFSTDVIGKPLLISTLVQAIDAMAVAIPSRKIIQELATYIWYDDSVPKGRDSHKVQGRCGAMSGQTDDLVIALGLALVAISAISTVTQAAKPIANPLHRGLWERSKMRHRGQPAMITEGRYFGG